MKQARGASATKHNGVIFWMIWAISYPTTSDAFLAPHHTLQTHHQGTHAGAPSAPSQALPIQGFPPSRESSMVLHASLFDRFYRVTRGNLNAALSKFEDPEKVLDQALADMQGDITKIRQTYSEVTAGQRRLLSQKNQYEAVAADWYRRAQLALERNNESLAREALARREQALQRATVLQQEVDAQSISLEKLYEGMKALEAKIVESQAKKAQLAARAKTAKTTAWVNDQLSGLTGKTSMDAFRRMEDKVAALETAAEISAEMRNTDLLVAPKSTGKSGKMDIELEFRRLEASDAVDRELEMMKRAMLPPSSDSRLEKDKDDSIQISIRSARPVEKKILLD